MKANDKLRAVITEIRAAELAARYADEGYRPGYDRFDYCPLNKSDTLCGLCEAHYLASAIASHQEES